MEIPYKRLLTTVAHLTSAESDDSSTSNGDNDPFESRQIISLDLCASSKRVVCLYKFQLDLKEVFYTILFF